MLSWFRHLLRRPVLKRCGGMLTLTDVYCIYNRARGTDLISPDDLRAAAGEFMTPTLASLGVVLRVFPSGLVVLQLADFNEEAAAHRIERLLLARATATATVTRAEPFLTSIDLATQWNVPLPIAQQLLLAAESRLLICRDESMSGLRFYLNRFCGNRAGA